MLVLDPIGMIDVEGQPVEAAPEQGRGVDAAFDVRDDVLEAHEAAGRSRWIVDINPHDVRQIVRGLHVEELGVMRAGRNSVRWGKSVVVRGDVGGGSVLKKKNKR